MPEAETVLGKLLNSALGEGKDGVPAPSASMADALPDYDASGAISARPA